MSLSVYGPGADSALLVEAATPVAKGVCLEVGVGSGWVLEHLLEATTDVTAAAGVDINRDACRAAANRLMETPHVRGVIHSDRIAAIGTATIDTLLCNPPYLPGGDPSPSDPIVAALDAGHDGLTMLAPLIAELPRILRPGAHAIFITSSESDQTRWGRLLAQSPIEHRNRRIRQLGKERLYADVLRMYDSG
mgnify:CR=1 FL=1